MTAPLNPHVYSDAVRTQLRQLMAQLEQHHRTLHAAERVIAEARGIVRYWDAEQTVVRRSALTAALAAYDEVLAQHHLAASDAQAH